MSNPFDSLFGTEGEINLPSTSGQTVQRTPSYVQNFTTPTQTQTANEVLLKLNSSGMTNQFTSFSESVTNIRPGMPNNVPGYRGGQFPDYTGTDYNPSNINQTLGLYSVPGRNGQQVLQTTEAQQIKEFRSQLSDMAGIDDTTISYKVKLTSMIDDEYGGKRQVVFDVRPTFSDTRTATYTGVDVIHAPGALQIYKSTESRNFQLQGKFVSNTSKEASINLGYIKLIRSWVMPFYGSGTEQGVQGKKYFGAPPEVLWFDAYGGDHFKRIPVVVTNYSFAFDEQYDMIPSNSVGDDKIIVPMPIVIAFTIDIRESYSPAELGQFDLEKYRAGDLTGAYGVK